MFGDPKEELIEEVEKTLLVYPLEDILLDNDLTIEEALVLLIQDGHIVLPETTPL